MQRCVAYRTKARVCITTFGDDAVGFRDPGRVELQELAQLADHFLVRVAVLTFCVGSLAPLAVLLEPIKEHVQQPVH